MGKRYSASDWEYLYKKEKAEKEALQEKLYEIYKEINRGINSDRPTERK